jgi:predicted permease
MLAALESVFSIILMIAVGFVLAKRGWFDESASALLTRLIVSLSLPAYMIANLMGGYDRARLLTMLPGLPVPFAIMLACLALATALAALFRLPRSRRGTFAAQFAFSNTVFIGLPVNILLFGDESLPYALIYYMANVCLFWTIGVYGIARDGAVLSGRPVAPIVSLEGLKRLLTPPLLSFLASVALIMVGVKLPRPTP